MVSPMPLQISDIFFHSSTMKHSEALRRGADPGVLVINARSLLVRLLNELLE